MDRDRFKKKTQITPPKRSINSEERPLNGPAPVVIQPTILPAQQHTISDKAAQKPPIQPSNISTPALFDGEDDDDIFGVWEKQKNAKKARQKQEAQAKAQKLATKILKKEQKKANKKASKPHDFAVSVSVPRVSKYRKRHPKLFYTLTTTLIVIVVLGVGYGVYNKVYKDNLGATEVLGDTTAKPDFDTVYSASNDATPLLYDPSKKVASYSDKLAGAGLTISQQPLPAGFAADPSGEVAKLAAQINATEKISAAEVTAYAGLSTKGPQTVVFAKNDLLVFIIADRKVETLDWIKYIDEIQ